MHVTCTHCESAYDVDLPESVLNSGRKRLKFRCGVCSQRFIIELEQPFSGADPSPSQPHESAETAAVKPSAPTPMRLRQEGTDYELADVATLQRWIVERRINPHDQISLDGETWESVGSRPDLKVFFQVVNQVERAEISSRAPSSNEDLPREDTEEASWRSEGAGSMGQSGDAFADLRSEETDSEDGAAANWDPMDPPNPRFQTDHGFNPSSLRSTVPDPFQEEDTQGHDVPSMGVSAETEPDPKTIALVAPIDSQEAADSDDFDSLFGGPTEIDGMTEEVAYPPSAALPEPFSRHDDGLAPEGGDEDPFFRAAFSDDAGTVDDGPDLPPVEPDPPTGNSQVPPMDDFTQEDSFSGGQTLFSVTDDDFLMDEDDDWEKEQARASQTRKRGLMAIAGLGLLFLAFQLMGGGDDAQETKETSTSGPSAQAEMATSEMESASSDNQSGESSGSQPASASNVSSSAETNETPPSPQNEAVAKPTESASPSTAKPAAEPSKSTVSPASSPQRAEGATSSFNSLVKDGWKYGDRGDYKTAERRFADAVQMKPNSAEALFGLGYAREQLGKTEQAYSHYCMTLKHEASGENRREAEGRLRAMGRTCTP